MRAAGSWFVLLRNTYSSLVFRSVTPRIKKQKNPELSRIFWNILEALSVSGVAGDAIAT